jgi:predicted kinase
VIRLVSSKEDRVTARALLEEYLRLPDGWPQHRLPASSPASISEYLDGFTRRPAGLRAASCWSLGLTRYEHSGLLSPVRATRAQESGTWPPVAWLHHVGVTATRCVVLVSGAPGAGKTTVAVPLAAALGLPLLSKDQIKETIFDALDFTDGDLAASRRASAAAMQLLWTLAETFPSVVLEANFRPHSDYERSRIKSLHARLIEVNCVCPPAVAAERYASRAASVTHHRAHVLSHLSDDLLKEFDQPLGVGHLIRVDTTKPVDMAALAATIQALVNGTGAVSHAVGGHRRSP